MSYSSTSKTSHFLFLYCLLSSYFHFLPYSTLHYLTCYHLKFILGNWFPLYLLLFIPAVTGQVSKSIIALIHPLSFSFQFCPQFSKSVLLVEQTTHERVIFGLRHCIDTSLVQNDLTSYTISAGVQDLYLASSTALLTTTLIVWLDYYPTDGISNLDDLLKSNHHSLTQTDDNAPVMRAPKIEIVFCAVEHSVTNFIQTITPEILDLFQ